MPTYNEQPIDKDACMCGKIQHSAAKRITRFALSHNGFILAFSHNELFLTGCGCLNGGFQVAVSQCLLLIGEFSVEIITHSIS